MPTSRLIRLAWALLLLAASLLPAMMAEGAIIYSPEGRWPKSWGPELEALRAKSRTGEFWGGSLDAIVLLHEIPLESREEFERLWPVLLSLRSPDTPVGLYSPPVPEAESGEQLPGMPQVLLRVTGPLSHDLADALDPANTQQDRIELFLYVDGRVIDLNHLRFPEPVTITDHRDVPPQREAAGHAP